MKNSLVSEIARRLVAIENCENTNNTEWQAKHKTDIAFLVTSFMPSGSGIDRAVKLDFDASKADKLVFDVAFHHMNEGGYYDGWTEHRVIVTPSLSFGFNVTVTGRDRNQVKDYLAQVFQGALSTPIEYQPEQSKYVAVALV